MKRTLQTSFNSLGFFVSAVPFFASLQLLAQLSSTNLAWHATVRDGCSTRYEATEPITNALTGEVTNRSQSYVRVATGLNYLDETGHWAPSQDLIELTSDGGAAARCMDQ